MAHHGEHHYNLDQRFDFTASIKKSILTVLVIGAVLTSGIIYQTTKHSYFKVFNTKIGLMVIVNGGVYTLEEIRKCSNDC
jgi:hypothetical protein